MLKTKKINYAKYSFEFELKSKPGFLILPEEKLLKDLTEIDLFTLRTDDMRYAVQMLDKRRSRY